jgi:PIN domain nuclease of toxin-antitoxin system
MLIVVADTHAILWYLVGDSRLSSEARRRIDVILMEGNQVGVSAITLVEVVYLIDKRRIAPELLSVIFDAIKNGSIVLLPVDESVIHAMQRIDHKQVPEMADRIIAATALAHQIPIISRDAIIQASGLDVIW